MHVWTDCPDLTPGSGSIFFFFASGYASGYFTWKVRYPMKRIELSQGQVALVDDEDHEWLSQFNWHAEKRRNTFYAVRNKRGADGKRRRVYMHREIMKTPRGMDTDHCNGDGLDNGRANLRICTRADNRHNEGVRSNNTSGYKGVSWDKRCKNWQAYISVNGKMTHLGNYTDKVDAARAYDKAALELHGSYARINLCE